MGSRPLAVIAVSGVIAMLLAGSITTRTRASEGESDMLVRMFGATAEVASQSAMDRADLYLHAGAAHDQQRDDPAQDAERAHTLPLQGVLARLHGATAPEEHKHIEGAEEKELLPWFVIAARLNPRNIEAWLDGGYWYYRTGKVEEAERFITQGIKHNPKDHRVYLERGILYHRMKRWDDAVKDLETSIKLYKKLNDDSPFELKAARIYLRDSREKLAASTDS